jgi:RNA polymerase-interacting CarD/CdnL/TRCF family regulator
MTNRRRINKLDNILLGNGVAMPCQSHWQGSQKGAQPWPNRSHVEENVLKNGWIQKLQKRVTGLNKPSKSDEVKVKERLY